MHNRKPEMMRIAMRDIKASNPGVDEEGSSGLPTGMPENTSN